VVTFTWNMTARLWDAETGQELKKVTVAPDAEPAPPPAPGDGSAGEYDLTAGYRFVHFGPDGTRVVLCSFREYESFARVYDLATGQALTQPLKHGGDVSSAVFSPDGKRVVTASEDQTARVWDAATGKAISPPLKHDDKVRHASFSPDGQRVVTASYDQTA